MSDLSRRFKTVKQWEKYTKNPKYCNHVNGYVDRMDGILRCITCDKIKT
jgi:hypothetical protein